MKKPTPGLFRIAFDADALRAPGALLGLIEDHLIASINARGTAVPVAGWGTVWRPRVDISRRHLAVEMLPLEQQAEQPQAR